MFLGSVAVKAQKAGRRIAESMPFKMPVGGWDTRSNIADMPSDHAVTLDNVFPDGDKVVCRNGSEQYATGMTDDIDTLLAYTPESGTNKFFAANGASIYNISASGAVGAAAATGFTNSRWQYVNMTTSGGHFLFMCNGADTPNEYDGTTFSSTSISSGPTNADLVWCNLHQRRLWVGEKNSASAYYGGTDSIGGAFTEFPLGALMSLGGYIAGMGTWTRDSGVGADDVAVFVTSEGEAIVYSGTDPSDAATWSLVGVFKIGKPIGRRFFVKAGGDLILITQDGFVSASTAFMTDRSQAGKTAISSQINEAVNTAVRSSGSNFGWQPIIYPIGKQLLVNIPIDGTTSHQYVFHTLTQAPCRFTGWNANCFELFNDELYFGGKDGVVYKADTGITDDGASIQGVIIPAFSYFGSKDVVKKFDVVEIIFRADGEVSSSIHVYTDFTIPVVSPVITTVGGGSLWDEAEWDDALWGGEQAVRLRKSVSGIGTTASVGIQIVPNRENVSVVSGRIFFTPGGYLG